MRSRYTPRTGDCLPPWQEEECVEVPLLLPTWQCSVLERAARGQEMTVGQLLRRLIGKHLRGEPSSTATGVKDPVQLESRSTTRTCEEAP